MQTSYILFLIFAVVAYFVITDESVATAFYFVLKLIKIDYEKKKWWLLNNPATPWARYSMWRRSNQLAKEFMKELESDNK